MSYTKTVWRNNQAPAINADNLNHIEQGIESAHNQMAINTSDIETLTTQVQGNTSNIASEISARQSGDSSLQSQIDQIIAPSGEAPSAAEVENARIAAIAVGGETYDTLGNAIRGQVTKLNDDLNELVNNGNDINYINIVPVDGKYIDGSGDEQSNSAYHHTQHITVKKNDIIRVSAQGSGCPVIVLYSSNDEMIFKSGNFSSGVTEYSLVASADGYAIVNCIKTYTSFSVKVISLAPVVVSLKSNVFDTLSGASYWKQGRPSSWTNGTHVTTNEYLNKENIMEITLPGGWYGNLYAYNGDTGLGYYKNDGTWGNSLDNSSYIQATHWDFKNILKTYPTYDFCFVARKTSGASIAPSDAVVIELFKNKIDAVNSKTDNVNDRVDFIQSEIDVITSSDSMDFSFDGTLYSTDGKHSFSYTRPSVAYDDEGNQVSANIPVYSSMKYFGQKGISMAPGTTNFLSSEYSQELSSSVTLSLSAGDYSVSVGEGEVTITGDVSGKAVPYKYFSFTLDSSGSITITSSGASNAKFVQVEKLPYATPWQIGGTERKIGTLVMDNVADITFSEFGVGMIFRPINNSDTYQNNEERLVNGYKDDDNLFWVEFIYRSELRKHFQAYFKIGGNVYAVEAPWNSDKSITFTNQDILGFYMHVIPGRGIYLYAMKNGIVTPSFEYTNIPALGQILSLAVGQVTINDGGRRSADCIISNVRFDIDTKPDAMAYFKEVLEQ